MQMTTDIYMKQHLTFPCSAFSVVNMVPHSNCVLISYTRFRSLWIFWSGTNLTVNHSAPQEPGVTFNFNMTMKVWIIEWWIIKLNNVGSNFLIFISILMPQVKYCMDFEGQWAAESL